MSKRSRKKGGRRPNIPQVTLERFCQIKLERARDLRGQGKLAEAERELLDALEEALKPVDLEVGMNAALHEHARSAHGGGFGDLL